MPLGSAYPGASLSFLVCFATARKRAAQDTREKALARFSHPPTTDEQDLDVDFVYKGGVVHEMVETEA